MQPASICVLLLAITSSSLGSPLTQRRWEWTVRQQKGRDSQGTDGQTDQRSWKNGPFKMVVDQHPGVHIMANTNFQPPPPKSFDWRTKGVISPVQNSGALGSPVAIAAAECVESLHAIDEGQLISVSKPEVQDCCSQSMTDNVFDCIHNIGGLCSEQTYPVATGHCRNTSCRAAVQIQGGKSVPSKQVMQMIEALLICPLMVLVDASRSSFEMYQGGIYSDPDCSREQLDHAMQVVGYGEEDEKEYWICKNSWGETWGEKGYIRISKGNDMCGIESFASYPF